MVFLFQVLNDCAGAVKQKWSSGSEFNVSMFPLTKPLCKNKNHFQNLSRSRLVGALAFNWPKIELNKSPAC